MSEIIYIVAYNKYDGFPHLSIIFSQKNISPFYGSFNEKTNLRLKCTIKYLS